jgi:hypothetical protein
MTKPKPKPETCKRGHPLTNATIVVQHNGREDCMACLTLALHKPRRATRDLVRAQPRPRKPWLTAFTHNPGLFAECQQLYAERLERDQAGASPQARGRRGGKGRKGMAANLGRPVTIVGRGT